MKDTIKKYLEKKSIFKTKTFDCSEIAVCIPICNEYPNFMSVLKTLAISCAVANQQVQVVCCINNKKNCNNEILENNSLLKISVLDFTKENSFTEKQGVGWARKIAMDYALANGAKVLACLDADAFVDENYVAQLKRFKDEKKECATMDFYHKRIDDENQNSMQLNSAIQDCKQ